ncbi:MAG TPA: tRNA pseudouridine(38-40) synthase TruA [Desulfobulbaceae bacterium]|nr:tRNA pseudouridine(38-40) synthase TruA [Desulfobulbaceae bacterium]
METLRKRFKLVLEYDGSRYSGWQQQGDARTIQGSLLQAASMLYGEEVDIQGNGRTDRGVHALRFVAHLEARTQDQPNTLCRRLNDLLPQDINILEVQRAGDRFHARHNCIGRSYLYQIARRRSAFCHRYAWQVADPLKVRPMREAAALLPGMHDFTSFTDRQVVKKKSPLVMVSKVQIAETDDLYLFRLVASHFLWKMVRRITGVLVAVGREELTLDEVAGFLAEPANLSVNTAPAQGLFFERAFYNQEELDDFLADDTVRPGFF